MKIILNNKKINFLFFIEKKFIAGACLLGIEVKSIKLKLVNITNSYISIQNNIVYLNNCIINPTNYINKLLYKQRQIKLLLKKKEIIFLYFFYKKKGYTIIVNNILIINNFIKFTIAICKGKKKIDKRECLKKKYFLNNIKNYLI